MIHSSADDSDINIDVIMTDVTPKCDTPDDIISDFWERQPLHLFDIRGQLSLKRALSFMAY